jgi:hypothetical protein
MQAPHGEDAAISEPQRVLQQDEKGKQDIGGDFHRLNYSEVSADNRMNNNNSATECTEVTE